MAKRVPEGSTLVRSSVAKQVGQGSLCTASDAGKCSSHCLVLQHKTKEVIRRIAHAINVGGFLEREAIFYLDCAYDSSARVRHADFAALAVACLYVAMRMHQLPVNIYGMLIAFQPGVRPSNLSSSVADACWLRLPAVDYTQYVVHSLSFNSDLEPSIKAQVHTYSNIPLLHLPAEALHLPA